MKQILAGWTVALLFAARGDEDPFARLGDASHDVRAAAREAVAARLRELDGARTRRELADLLRRLKGMRDASDDPEVRQAIERLVEPYRPGGLVWEKRTGTGLPGRVRRHAVLPEGILLYGETEKGEGWLELCRPEDGTPVGFASAALPGPCSGVERLPAGFLVRGTHRKAEAGLFEAAPGWVRFFQGEGSRRWLRDDLPVPSVVEEIDSGIMMADLDSQDVGPRDRIRLLEKRGGETLWEAEPPSGVDVDVAGVAGNGVLAGGYRVGESDGPTDAGWAALLDGRTGKPIWEFDGEGLPGPVGLCAAEGEQVFLGGNSGAHEGWVGACERGTGRWTWKKRLGDEGGVSRLTLLPEGLLVSGYPVVGGMASGPSWFALHDRKTGALLWRQQEPGLKLFRVLPEGVLTAGAEGGTRRGWIRLTPRAGGDPLWTRKLPGPFGMPGALVQTDLPSADGRIAAGGDGWLGVYDLATGGPVWEITPESGKGKLPGKMGTFRISPSFVVGSGSSFLGLLENGGHLCSSWIAAYRTATGEEVVVMTPKDLPPHHRPDVELVPAGALLVTPGWVALMRLEDVESDGAIADRME